MKWFGGWEMRGANATINWCSCFPLSSLIQFIQNFFFEIFLLINGEKDHKESCKVILTIIRRSLLKRHQEFSLLRINQFDAFVWNLLTSHKKSFSFRRFVKNWVFKDFSSAEWMQKLLEEIKSREKNNGSAFSRLSLYGSLFWRTFLFSR